MAATKRSLIHIENCQVKSLKKARLLCKLLDTIEKEFGIRSVRLSFKGNFICPDIRLSKLKKTNMERLLSDCWQNKGY